ncbi:MAG TPA: RidA family protein [Blastocatellia bacterium]|nr:RidA family protein [Blastocatellia bacterium]
MEIKTVLAEDAPAPGGHYSQAVVYNGLVFVAGQLAIKANGERVLDSIEAQTEQAMANVAAILRAAGSDLGRLLKVTIYISDIDLWGAVNQVYARLMGEHRPARAVVPVKELHYGFQIEIEAIAALGD